MGETSRRVVSLAPSTTRIISMLGCKDALVGVTQHCPVDSVPSVGGWVTPDRDAVESLDPDVIFTTDALQREIREVFADQGYDVWYAEPTSLDDVLRTIETIGMELGVTERGEILAEDCRDRLATLKRDVPVSDPPTVYCEEWIDPMMAAGNWVPELVDIAGGSYPLVDAGTRSREVSPEDVEGIDPEYIVFNVCGHGSRVELDRVQHRDWNVHGEFVVVDDTLLNEPSPVLVDGAEYLAEIFHGDRPWNRGTGTNTPPF